MGRYLPTCRGLLHDWGGWDRWCLWVLWLLHDSGGLLDDQGSWRGALLHDRASNLLHDG